ncbi:serine hydrolase domain-containing protein [Undibacterium sp.]|uniref:serine hydrolase domain-containing protein n=1 Tax=Undibacterium sp. TaxID=1914977 RepID=UPI002B773419|nr:serine hydrolase domain-containing protein [Undibacterium sp.]HTD05587.1 serine hydrolase domain-containing protein [Undibacterium sp.]
MKEITSKLEALLADWNRSDAPGCVASVVQRGSSLLRKGYGMANLEMLTANSPATRMRIGSTTKHFTCILALMLRDEGSLDIDAPCIRYLPELPPSQGSRTLRQFMNHTGGTRDFLDLSMFSNGLSILPAEAALFYHSLQQEDNFAAGEMFAYNNGGYRLLSIAIERVTGMSLAQAFELRLFAPLEMRDTALWASDNEILPGVATSHVAQPDGKFIRGVFPSTILGEGGIVSTIDDMQRWLAHLRQPVLWSQQLSAELTKPTRLNNGYLNAYGLGLIREQYRGIEIIQHSGGVIGGTCQMLTAPELDINIIVVSNRNDLSAPHLAYQLLEAVAGDNIRAPAGTASALLAQDLQGDFLCADNDQLLTVTMLAGQLCLKYYGMPLPLEPADNDILIVNLLGVVDLSVEPVRNAVGKITAIVVNEQGRRMLFARVEIEAGKTADLLCRLAGIYRSKEMSAEFIIGEAGKNDLLSVQGRYGRNTFRLSPLGGDVFQLDQTDPTLPLTGTLRLAVRPGRRELIVNTGRTMRLRLHEVTSHAE